MPRTLHQTAPFTILNGPDAGQTIQPSFELVATYNDPPGPGARGTTFIATAAIGDILGWTPGWNPDTMQGSFTRPDGTVIVFTHDSPIVTVGGVQQTLLNSDNQPINAYIHPQGRFMVPIRFFRELGVNVQWVPGTTGNNTIIVTP
jgi:hypothetical protein